LVYVLFPATTPRAKRLLKPIRAGAGADQLVGAATTSRNCARARAARARRACARLRPVPSTTPRATRLLKPTRAGAGADQLVGAATASLTCARPRAARAAPAPPAPALVYVLFPATTPRAKRLLKPTRAGAGADQLVGAA